MEIAALQAQIAKGEPDSVYIFTGVEGAVQKVYISMLAEKTERTVLYIDTVADAVRAMTKPSLTPEKHVFVVFNDVAFTKAEKAWNVAFSRAQRTPHILVLQYPKIDGRGKFSKRHKDITCVFDRLGDEVAIKYVKKHFCNFQISDQTAQELAAACNNDYGRIQTECDKVLQYYESLKQEAEDYGAEWSIDDAAFNLLESGVIYKPIGDITFKVTDAICNRQVDEAAKYLQQATLIGEPPLLIVAVLYTTFRNMLMLQGLGADRSDAAKRTGLTPWYVKLASEKLQAASPSWTTQELIRNVRFLQGVEYGIKTGTIEQDIALYYSAISCIVGQASET